MLYQFQVYSPPLNLDKGTHAEANRIQKGSPFMSQCLVGFFFFSFARYRFLNHWDDNYICSFTTYIFNVLSSFHNSTQGSHFLTAT